MISFPKLPTDNFYKFLALAGLVFLFAIWISEQVYQYYLAEILFQVEKENKLINLGLDDIRKEIYVVIQQDSVFGQSVGKDENKALIDSLKSIISANDTVTGTTFELIEPLFSTPKINLGKKDFVRNKLDSLSQAHPGIKKLYDNSNTKFIELSAMRRKIEFFDQTKKRLNVNIDNLYCLSIIAIIVGFVFWWFKTQRYQDIIIKKEARAKEDLKINAKNKRRTKKIFELTYDGKREE